MFGPENIWLIALGGGASFIASVLYMVGGTNMGGSFGGQKWLRRYIATFILAAAANGIAIALSVWSWQLILMWPCLIGGFSLGYGGDSTAEKAIKRAVFAAGALSACMVGVWYAGFTGAAWLVFGIAGAIAATSVLLGVFNPFNNAPLEQYLICQVLTLFVPWWALVK